MAIDLLQFKNQTRHLTVIDIQLIHDYEYLHDIEYEHLLQPIRSAYPTLQQRMSGRFYDEDKFFSSQMLLGKEAEPDYVWSDLLPAYRSYVKIHLDLVRTIEESKLSFHEVSQRHEE
jgi:hypothetical protein